MRVSMFMIGVSTLAASAFADPNCFYIEAFAPETVMPGETFTVEFWGRVEHTQFIHGSSMVAWFGISALGIGNIQSLTTASIFSLSVGSNVGVVVGSDLLNVSGGQLPNVINPVLLDRSNPILLFSFDVTAGDSGIITYTPGLPHPTSALAFFLVSTGAQWLDHNSADSTLVLTGATTRIIPGPGVVAMMGLGFGVMTQRRQRVSRQGVNGGVL